MNSVNRYFIRCAPAAVSFLLSGWTAVWAADAEISADDWDGLSNGINGLYGALYRLLKVVMGFGALVAAVRVAVKMYQGEREAASRLVWWFVGFVFGLVMLVVIKSVLG